MAKKVAADLERLSLEAGWLNLLYKPLVEKIETEEFFPGLESFLPLFYDELASVGDYAGPEVVRLVFSPDRFIQAGEAHLDRLAGHIGQDYGRGTAPPALGPVVHRSGNGTDRFEAGRRWWKFGTWPLPVRMHRRNPMNSGLETHRDLQALIESSRGFGPSSLAPLAARIKAWREKDLESGPGLPHQGTGPAAGRPVRGLSFISRTGPPGSRGDTVPGATLSGSWWGSCPQVLHSKLQAALL